MCVKRGEKEKDGRGRWYIHTFIYHRVCVILSTRDRERGRESGCEKNASTSLTHSHNTHTDRSQSHGESQGKRKR